MIASMRRLGVLLGRWPRRIAALACLLLAAGSALAPPDTTPKRPASRLHSGEVAVPIAVHTAAEVRTGQRVGVVAAPDDAATGSAQTGATAAVLIADRLRVLSVRRSGSGVADEVSAVVTVATDRAHALRIAEYSSRPLLLIADDLP